MQEAEEQDTCRICSAPAEPDQPLFHPCKCSGTIRYIHQDCLTTWLAHSKKKTCDVCKHQYSFTKVYAADMPSRLPALLVLRRLIQQGFFGLLMFIRAIVVSMVWLSIVPLLTVWSWRMYFSMGDSTAWWISNRQPSHIHNVSTTSELSLLPQIVEFAHSYFNEPNPPPSSTAVYTLLGRIVRHPAWISLSADIFTGQIIAALIVITFVAIFLLREWISQNARPGLFDEDDNAAVQPQQQDILQVPPALQQPAPQALAVPRPAGQRMDVNARLALAHRQNEAIRALDALRDIDRQLTEEEERAEEERARTLGRSANILAPPPSGEDWDRFANMRARKRRSDKGKEKEMDDGEGEIDETRLRHIKLERMKRRNFTRRLAAARQNGNKRRQNQDQRPDTDPFDIPADSNASSSRTPPPPASFFPPVSLERQNGSIPFSFVFPPPKTEAESTSAASSPTASNTISFGSQASTSSRTSASPPPAPAPFALDNDSTATTSFNASISRPGSPLRRPPLPTTLLTTPGSSGSGLGSPMPGPFSPKTKTPLASPSLATYRAPEELTGLETEDYFATTTDLRDQLLEGEEDDDTETLDGHEVDEDPSNPLIVPLREEEQDEGNVDDDMRIFFRDGTGEEDVDDDDDDDDGDSDADVGELLAHAPQPGPQVIPPPVLMVDDEEEEDEEEDEEEEEDGEEAADEFGEERRRDPPPARRVVAFEGGPGGRRVIEVGDNIVPVPAQGLNAQPQQPLGEAQAGNQGDDEAAALIDDLEAGVEDDMDGAMEAIGLRGPIYGLIQNAALMVFIMDSIIGVGIWVPYTLGKSIALLMLEPRRLLYILHLPIRAIRIATDPAVDLVAYLITDVLLPFHLNTAATAGGWVFRLSMWIVAESLGEAKAVQVQRSCLATSALLESYVGSFLRALGFVDVPVEVVVASVPEAVSQPTILSQAFETSIDYVEPYFAPIGEEVQQIYTKSGELWTQLATGDGPVEKIFSVVFGYCLLASILAVYLNILTVGNVKTAGRAVRGAVKQQLLVLKVATFIFIELVTFPLGCGIVLDVCTLWLFPSASYTSRMEFVYQAPLTTIFYHWVAGTMFMYSFAVLLSGCRSVMRPGAMWFIKDPQDQNSHPIRDILDRDALVQFRKICISGIMYSFIVACAVATVAGLLFLGRQVVLPFRWKTREPLSSVPIDLLFLNLALPYTMTYFRPRKALRRLTIVVWKGLARRLRLTSYFFGKRHGEEEYTPKTWSLSRIIHGPKQDASVLADDYDGTFRRVPNTDDIAIPREMRATVAVDAAGEAVDDAARDLMSQQDKATLKARRNIKQDFTVVYLPPHFRYRMILFVALLWSIGAFCIGISLVLPILLGRGFFGIIFKGKREVHDGYSVLAGFYMLWACWIAGRAVDRLDKRRQRWGTEGPRASLWWLAVKRGLLWLVKASYMAIFLGVVIPTLVGGVVELYVILPFKLHTNQAITVPRIRVLDCWATGLLYMKIAMRVTRRQGQNPISRGIQVIKRNGWTHPDPIAATRDVIGPVAGGLTVMILLPAAIFFGIDYFFPLVGRHVDPKFIFAYVYSGLFCLAALTHTFVLLRDMLTSWSQAVRDKEFLVEMRLKNHDPTPNQTPTATILPEIKRDDGLVQEVPHGINIEEDVVGADRNM
ncbi:hypothetical protein GYMLUDRAFT_198796 [Collybiopsis luxurians FD-317 M1]|uniref:RING-type E3 ubiquitin transferase n=1 Tax=Collybiopsis luxurians FD-317 M1 TaxID=944289 RepID=A0A0D0CRW7_9AGAR|nr:hypothetical protein GYMLUDRAFT_198796 [Collybiopsis luxurians FD-317 M1]